jgi:hypothetical protein
MSYGVLHCCSFDAGLLKVRLVPGSDRTADGAADPGCAKYGHTKVETRTAPTACFTITRAKASTCPVPVDVGWFIA